MLLIVQSNRTASRAVARALIGGGGVYIHILGRARLVSFEMKLISKEVSRVEPEYINIHPPPRPPISVLATALTASIVISPKLIMVQLTTEQRIFAVLHY